MSCKVLNYCCSRLSYLKYQKITPDTWKLTSKRFLCTSSSDDDDATTKRSHKSVKSSNKDKQKEAVSSVSETKSDKQNLANEKLLNMLSDFQVNSTLSNKKKLNLVKPPQRLNKPKDKNEEKEIKLEDQIKSAVKNIVSSAATDESEKIEAELLDGASVVSPSLISPPVDDSNETEQKSDVRIVDEETEENIISAVKAVASTVVSDPEYEQSELTKKLLALTVERQSDFPTSDKEKMKDLFEGMKIETTPSSALPSLGDRSQDIAHKQRRFLPQTRRDQMPKVDLFNAPPLNIFVEPEKVRDGPKLRLWQKLCEKELKLMIQYAPTNPYEEMIRLTEEGKHWKLPVDNEIDMGEEENVSFHEHVFLDHLLEGFPKKGPVRHFMELITTGLSKNPYVTVERKKEHIEWFRNYFEQKKDILGDCWK